MRAVPDRHRRSASLVAPLASLVLLVAACGGAGSTPGPTASSAPPPSPAASPSPSGSASSPSASAAASGALDGQLKALADEIAGQVATIRELDLLRPIKTEVLDQAALDAFVLRRFDEETPPAELTAQEGLYKRLGLLPPDASLRDLTVDLLTSQVLGFYDTDDETFRVVARGDAIGGIEKFTMSHELDHALQDQHFDLDKLLPPDLKEQGDLLLARRSVAEGDATLVMTQWATGHLTPQELVDTLAAANDPEAQAVLARTPAILTAPLEFPYVQGLQLVMSARSGGGWSAVDDLYADPPSSTEQVLHPAKYAAREAPIPVELPSDLATRLGAGWSLATEDTFGEYLTALWLQRPGDGATSVKPDPAAEGWGGDRMAYLTGPGGADAAIWETAWDTQADAQEFYQAAAVLVDASGGGHSIEVDPDDPTRIWIVLTSDKSTMCKATDVLGFAACHGP
jgi:hypothetical protein